MYNTHAHTHANTVTPSTSLTPLFCFSPQRIGNNLKSGVTSAGYDEEWNFHANDDAMFGSLSSATGRGGGGGSKRGLGSGRERSSSEIELHEIGAAPARVNGEGSGNRVVGGEVEIEEYGEYHDYA